MAQKKRSPITVIAVTVLLLAFLTTVAAVTGVKVLAISLYIGF